MAETSPSPRKGDLWVLSEDEEERLSQQFLAELTSRDAVFCNAACLAELADRLEQANREKLATLGTDPEGDDPER